MVLTLLKGFKEKLVRQRTYVIMLKYLSDPLKKKLAHLNLNKNKGIKRKPDKEFKIRQV